MKRMGKMVYGACRLALMILVIGVALSAASAPAHAGFWDRVKQVIKVILEPHCSQTLGCPDGVPYAVA